MMREFQPVESKEAKLRVRYVKLSKVLLVLTLLTIVLVVAILLGVYLFELEHNWAILSLEYWMYVGCGLIGFFILVEVIFFVHLRSVQERPLEEKKPKAEFFHGKRLYVYTIPTDAEGGIFSKTYIEIDEENLLRLRTLMIPPEELWG